MPYEHMEPEHLDRIATRSLETARAYLRTAQAEKKIDLTLSAITGLDASTLMTHSLLAQITAQLLDRLDRILLLLDERVPAPKPSLEGTVESRG